MANDEMMSTKELSEFLGIPVNSIIIHFSKDPSWLPHMRLGRLYRFNKAEVVEHLKKKSETAHV